MPDNKERRWYGERKWIKYRARLTEDRKSVAVNILEQSHRHMEFGNTCLGHEFTHEGYRLGSYSFPEQIRNDATYLQGNLKDRDDTTLYMTLETYQKFKATVLAYNKYFKGDSED